MDTTRMTNPFGGMDVKAFRRSLGLDDPLSPVVSCSARFELKIKVIEFTWKSGILVARNGGLIDTPHWTEQDSPIIPEEDKEEIQHYGSGSKRPGVYLIRNKGADTAEVKINIHLIDPNGEVVGKKYKLYCDFCDLKMQSVDSFTMTSGTHTVTMKITNLPDTLQHYEGKAIFTATPEDKYGRDPGKIENNPLLEVFVIYDNPMTFYTKGVWVEALRLVFKKAGVTGLYEPKSISAKVTEYCHSGHGMTYDTKFGASRFIESITKTQNLGGEFCLRNYIEKISRFGDNILNCYDSAAAVQTLCGALGVKTQWIFQEPFGYIKKSNLVGVGLCNNPFFKKSTYSPEPLFPENPPTWKDANNLKRSFFARHAFVAGVFIAGKKPEHDICDNIYDACAKPHIGDKNLEKYFIESIDIDIEIKLFSNEPLTETERNIFLKHLLDNDVALEAKLRSGKATQSDFVEFLSKKKKPTPGITGVVW